MTIDRKSKIPLYEQLKLLLQDQILLGVLAPGMLLPTELQLCQKYDISRITVRNALSELERSGLIERIQGRGSNVKEKILRKIFAKLLDSRKLRLLNAAQPVLSLLLNFNYSCSDTFLKNQKC